MNWKSHTYKQSSLSWKIFYSSYMANNGNQTDRQSTSGYSGVHQQATRLLLNQRNLLSMDISDFTKTTEGTQQNKCFDKLRCRTVLNFFYVRELSAFRLPQTIIGYNRDMKLTASTVYVSFMKSSSFFCLGSSHQVTDDNVLTNMVSVINNRTTPSPSFFSALGHG